MEPNPDASVPESLAISGGAGAKEREPFLRRELVASPWELGVILLVAIGIPAFKSAWMGWHGSSGTYQYYLLSNRTLCRLVAEEALLLGGMLGFIRWRGWRFRDFKVKPSLRSSLSAFLVLLASISAVIITVCGMKVLGVKVKPGLGLRHHPISLDWSVLIGVSIFNAFFEELTTMAYAFNQFAARRGPAFALIVTVLLRVSCHTYQGFSHLLPIGALFLVFGGVYIRYRNLWPLILAHAIYDIAAMGGMKLYLSH